MSKHLCPTNILKFSMLTSLFNKLKFILGLRRTHFPGSATATICVLNNRDMTALNLGDSGFILIRFD
jgi:serine/threonine protein phosphatase PrpC